MVGQFWLHGPYAAVNNPIGDDVVTKLNPHTWVRVANIIYLDQPVGAGENFLSYSLLLFNNTKYFSCSKLDSFIGEYSTSKMSHISVKVQESWDHLS